MKRYLALLMLFAVPLLPASSFSAEKKEAAGTIERMSGEVIRHFPRAEGRVTFAEGRKVKVDIGSKDGLKSGMELLLYRAGKPIRHPVTKAVLGNQEESLGRLAVTGVGEKESEGTVNELLVTQIVQGDICRLPTGRTRLLLAVYGKEYNELALSRLVSRLEGSGRFVVVGPLEIPKEPALDSNSASGLAAGNDALNVLTFKTVPTKRQERTRLDLVLYSRAGEEMERQSGVVDVTAEVYGETVMDYPLVRGEHRDFYHIEDLPFRAGHMAAGDLTGDGRTEFAISDGHAIIVYAFKEGAFRELWREGAQGGGEHLDVECADLNGNGFDEIYVTSFESGHLASYVVEYDGGAFRKVAGPLPLFFRVLDVPGAGKELITSTIGKDAPYSGIVQEYRWEGGALVKAGRIKLPDRIKDPYGFVLVDIAPAKAPQAGAKDPYAGLEIVWVDDSDYVQVLDMKGKRLWKSPERYGGYDNFFEMDRKDLSMPNVDTRGKVKGRLILREGPEGEKEVILTKNIPITYATRRFRGYSGAEVYSFAWNGTGLETRWSIKGIDGYLADIYIGDISNNGREAVAVLTNPTFKFIKKSKSLPIGSVGSVKNLFEDKASLLVYRIPQR